MNYIKENLLELESTIQKAVDKAGRKREDITLIAVSKTFPAEVIPVALSAGQIIFAENKVQEGEEKRKILIDYDFQYHLIGHLQSNKVNKAIKYFNMIHSVDSLELAKKINDSCIRETITMPILLQVNTSAEAQKSGMPYNLNQIQESIVKMQEFSAIQVCGFMTMGPMDINESETRRCFQDLQKLQNFIQETLKIDVPHLSMGMSHDFHWAIEEGATMIRTGNAIFGKRSYQS